MLEAILFDFDYTLGDSSEGIIHCVGHALETMGLPPAEAGDVRGTIGLPLEVMLERLTGRCDPPAGRRFRELFVRRADAVILHHTHLVEGAREVIAELRAAGYRLGIVTTKYAYRILQVLERDGLREAFEVVVGSDQVERPKPHPEPVRRALQRLGTGAGDALFVGDSLTDAEAAMRAGTPFVAVLTGVTPEAAFEAFPVLAVLESVRRLPAWLVRTGEDGLRATSGAG